MRVLLTGASGFLGRYVSQILISKGIDYVTVGRSSVPNSDKHIHTDLLSLSDYSAIVRDANATHLIHLAWYTEHGKYWSSALNFDWIKATSMLVEDFCKKGGEHITITGTCAEYDWRFGYHTENLTPINPKTIYGVAKDASHRICRNICVQYGVPLIWGRVFFPYGKGEIKTRLLPALAEVFRDKKAPFGVNGDFFRDFLHVKDVANALVVLSSTNSIGCVNISSGEPVLVRDIVIMMADLMSADPSEVLSMSSGRTEEPNMLIGNNNFLQSIGWRSSIKLADGIKDFL